VSPDAGAAVEETRRSGFDPQRQRELNEIVESFRDGRDDQWLDAARRLVAFASALVKTLEARVSPAAGAGQHGGAASSKPEPVRSVPRVIPGVAAGNSPLSFAREALTAADAQQRKDRGLALATAIVAWHRARVTGASRLVADAAVLVGRALVQCNADALAAAYLRVALDNGGEVELAELAIARQAGRGSPEASIEQAIVSVAEKGRRLLLRQPDTRQWPELIDAAWADLVDGVVRRAGI